MLKEKRKSNLDIPCFLFRHILGEIKKRNQIVNNILADL